MMRSLRAEFFLLILKGCYMIHMLNHGAVQLHSSYPYLISMLQNDKLRNYISLNITIHVLRY